MKQSPEMQQLLHKATEAKKIKYSCVPAEFIPPVKLSDRTDKGLCKCIAEWLRLNLYEVSICGNTVTVSINGQKRRFTTNVKQPGSGFSCFAAFYQHFSQLTK